MVAESLLITHANADTSVAFITREPSTTFYTSRGQDILYKTDEYIVNFYLAIIATRTRFTLYYFSIYFMVCPLGSILTDPDNSRTL